MLPKTHIAAFGCVAAVVVALCAKLGAAEYQWPEYSPNIAYDFNEEFGPLDPPTKILPGVSGIDGVYADGWWCFVWGDDKNPQVTENAWIPMIDRFNRDFAYMTDVLGWPRDKHSQNGYYSTVFLFGSGLSTDNASNTTPGGWMGTTGWNGEPWHNVLASYIPVSAFDPAYEDAFQTGAMIHEGIHAIFANMPGGYNSAWGHESFNVWLQSTMEAQRNGSFSGMGGLSAGSQIAPFIPIECYSGWLQDGSFGGPGGQGVNKANESGQQICTWRAILGGYQYGEAFPHALAVILGPKAIPWIWNNADESGFLLQDMALAPGGLGDAQARRVIQEYRGRQAFQDFKQWSHAFRQLLHGYWGAVVQEEWAPYDVDVEPWTMTCYVATTQSGGTLTPEARTLPGWSGANQIPLTVDPAATEVSVTFHPTGANMSCQLVYRDTDGAIHYSTPVSSGVCTLPVSDVLNHVVVAVVCNTDYVYEGEQTRTAKFGYTLDIGAGVTGTADIHTKWWDYNPDTYTIAASAGANGSIHPSGAVVVNNGAVQTFAFSPAPGYEVGDVLLNGLTVGAPSSYTLNPVLSDNTLQVVFRDATPPTAPGGLGAVAMDGGVDLDWADNGESDLSGYRVYRATTGGGDYALVASGVSTSRYTDTAVVDGASYFYVVTAVDVESNESGFSSEASATAIDTIAPAPPTGLVASGTGTAVGLTWTPGGEPDLASYTVYRSTTSGGGYVAIASGLTGISYTDSPLVPGTTYHYVVTATDGSSNESGYSGQATPVSALLVHWDFNDPSLGAANGAAVPDSDNYNVWRTAALDKSGNGNDLTTWNYSAAGFTWSDQSEDGDFSIKSAGDYPSAFTWSSRHAPTGTDVEQFSGTAFTVEAQATISGGGYRAVVSRDAQNLATNDAGATACWLGLDPEGRARFFYTDVNGKFIELVSQATFAADDNVFRHFAATSDGSTVSLHVDGALVAQSHNTGMAGLGKGASSGSGYHAGGWTVGRALHWGNHVDRWHGYIDSVSIASAALEPGAFVLSDAIAPGDPAPAAPTGLTAIAGDGTVALDWADNGEPDLGSYTVYRSSTPGGGFAPIRVGLTTSSYTDPRADNGVTYYYVVTATDVAFGESDLSAAVSADPTDVTPPAAPTGFSAVPGSGSVGLYWNDNSDPDLASYTVYRSTTSGSGHVPIASGLTVSAFIDNAAASGVTYHYFVTASDTSAQESAGSVEVSAASLSSQLLTGALTGSSGSWNGQGNTAANAFDGNLGTYYDAANASGDWAGLDLGSPEAITQVKYAPRGGFSGRMVGGRFEASNSADFSSGVVTLFTVGAAPVEGVLTQQEISSAGTFQYVRYIGPAGAYCNVAELEFHTAAAADTTAPAAPGGLVATPAAASVGLDWADSPEADLSSYTVYRSTTSGSGYAILASGLVASALTDTSVAHDTTYHYVITAKDYASNESAASVEASATYVDTTPPLAPAGLSAVAGNAEVVLDWNDHPAHDPASYTVYRSTTGGSGYALIATGIASSTYTDSTVTNGTTYFYVVTATDTASNESGSSAEVSATPFMAPGVSLSAGVPPVHDGVQNLGFSPDDGGNTQHGSVPSDYLGSQYRGDDLQMAQSFTTGTNADGYTLTSVSVRQVGWGSTDWDYDGGSVKLRIFDLSATGPGPVLAATEMTSETAIVSGTGSPAIGGTPANPRWLTFTLTTPVSLAPGTMYAFAFGATGGTTNQEFFMNLDGTATDSYTDGFSLTVPDGVDAMWDGGNGRPGDRAFVAAMTAVDIPPAAPTGLVAMAGNGRVDLDWADNTESDLAGYTVYRSITSGSGYAEIASGLTTSAYTDDTVVNGTTYHYVVTATDTVSQESVASLEVSALPAPPVISVNYEKTSTTPPLDPGDLVGAYPAANWNHVVDLDHDITFVDDSNEATPLTVALSGGVTDSWNTVGTPDENLFGDKVVMGSSPQTLTLGNVPYAKYDLYLYLSSWGNEVVEFGINGGPVLATLTNTFNPNGAPGEDFVNNDTYVKLEGLVGDVVVNMDATSDELHLAGFQIVQVVDPAPSPPSGLVAAAGNGSVDLDWADNTESDLASYTVYRSTTSGGAYAPVASGLVTSDYTDATAVSGTTYHYVVTAINVSGNESSDSAEVSGTSMTPAQSWRFEKFETLANTGDAADTADPDKDSISNLLERAFGGDPHVSDTGILPSIDPEMPMLSIKYRVNLEATDLSFEVQENTDLQGTWDPASGSEEIVETIGNIRIMRFTRPVTGEAALFLRVGVSGP